MEDTSRSLHTINEKAALEALSTPIGPVKLPFRYRLSTVPVAVAMVLLPLLYLALIAGVGWLVWWHATRNVGYIGLTSGRNKVGALMLYLAPIFVGATAILFMLKPILLRPEDTPKNLALDGADEPLLFRLVEKLCHAVGAPVPTSIEVDCDVNASARLRQGFASFFSQDLTLTIGLPLAAGFTAQQFVGVLAHEFGHFAQRGGMRLTYIIGRVNAWFYRVVYERDRWDRKLETAIGSDTGWLTMLTIVSTRALIWVSRKILWLLMHVGHAMSCGLLRQMEFDADHYQARIAGSEAIEDTFLALHLNAGASQGALMELERQWAELRLGDNLPRLIHQHALNLPEEAVAHVKTGIQSEETGLFSTHPSSRERIERVQLQQAPGVFCFNDPAARLFSDFDALCKKATTYHYSEVLGIDLEHVELASADALMEDHRRAVEGVEAAEEFFHGAMSGMRQPVLGEQLTEPPDNPAGERDQIRAAGVKMAAKAASAIQTSEQYQEAHFRLCMASGAAGVLRAGFKVKADEYGLSAATIEGVELAVTMAEQAMHETEPEFESQLAFAGRRFSGALRFLHAPLFRVRHAEAADMAEEFVLLVSVLEPLCKTHAPLQQAASIMHRLAGLFKKIDSHGEHEDLIAQVILASQELYLHLVEVRTALEGVPYPFRHAAGAIDIADSVLPQVPPEQDLGNLTAASESVENALIMLYGRIMGRLCHMTLLVEQWLGIEVISPPTAVNEDLEEPRVG